MSENQDCFKDSIGFLTIGDRVYAYSTKQKEIKEKLEKISNIYQQSSVFILFVILLYIVFNTIKSFDDILNIFKNILQMIKTIIVYSLKIKIKHVVSLLIIYFLLYCSGF